MPVDLPVVTPALSPALSSGDDPPSVRVARQPEPPPRLRAWSSAWRYLCVVALALVLLVVVSTEVIPPDGASDDVVGRAGAALLLDAVLGTVALCLLPLRRRAPVRVAGLTAVAGALSTSAFAAAVLATVSMSTRARWREICLVGVLWVGGGLTYELAYAPLVPGTEPLGRLEQWGAPFVMLAAYAACVLTGVGVGQRRRLVTSLHERAATAEREQELRTTAAREAERTRIAREMHDVLAHRISLVALHAGALTSRDDLTREQTAATAGIIADNAQLAMSELRQVLGVLRGGARQGRPAEPPQPTLAELPALLADAAEAGARVDVDATSLDAADMTEGLPETVSRTAFRDRAGGADERPQARARTPGSRSGSRAHRDADWSSRSATAWCGPRTRGRRASGWSGCPSGPRWPGASCGPASTATTSSSGRCAVGGDRAGGAGGRRRRRRARARRAADDPRRRPRHRGRRRGGRRRRRVDVVGARGARRRAHGHPDAADGRAASPPGG